MTYDPDVEWCRHYTGLSGPGMVEHKTCAAGVEYATVIVPPNGTGLRLPCLGAASNVGGCECAKREVLTAEEHAEKERVIRARMDGMRAAMTTIRGLAADGGIIECPACHGRLHYARARSNGHVRAKCETTGCLVWMQ